MQANTHNNNNNNSYNNNNNKKARSTSFVQLQSKQKHGEQNIVACLLQTNKMEVGRGEGGLVLPFSNRPPPLPFASAVFNDTPRPCREHTERRACPCTKSMCGLQRSRCSFRGAGRAQHHTAACQTLCAAPRIGGHRCRCSPPPAHGGPRLSWTLARLSKAHPPCHTQTDTDTDTGTGTHTHTHTHTHVRTHRNVRNSKGDGKCMPTRSCPTTHSR